jgi:hypothetical protein
MLPRSSAPLLLPLLLAASHCGKDPVSPPEAGSVVPAKPAAPLVTTSASSTPSASAGPSASAPTQAPHIPALAALEKELRAGIPKGSGNYARALALATLHKRGTIPFDQLEAAVLALRLPPHKLGDGYLLIPSPVPPPGTPFDPKMMPDDWEGTWGEVAMAYHLGVLDRDQYEKLHRAAHPTSCKHK